MNIDQQGSSIILPNNVSFSTAASLAASSASDAAGKDFAQRLQQAVADKAAKATDANDKKLKATCKDMESVFLNMMYTSMRKTVPKDSLLGESNEDDIMQSMLDTELTKKMSQAGGVGLADLLYRQLSAQQSAQKK